MTRTATARTLSVVAALLVSGAGAAMAETVYRCGNSYSQVPCATSTAIDVDDSRNATQRGEAAEVAARERSLALSMTRDREHAEALAAVAARPVAQPKNHVGSAVPRVKYVRLKKTKSFYDEDGNFVLVGPKPTKAASGK